jgi:GNAT superfamily N-acetyltransferase
MGEACAFTARSGGVVVASGMYTQPYASAVEFMGISTLSPHRRKGFGGALVSHMLGSAWRRGVTTAILTVSDTGASRVYERAGFALCATLARHEWRASTSER